jgi:HK97 family phage major capsid protein
MDLKTMEQDVRARFEAMEAAHRAIETAAEDADLDALADAFEEARQAHAGAKAKLERHRNLEEARAALPVEPVEDTKTDTHTDVSVTREESVYRKNDPYTSHIRDMALAKLEGDQDAQERLRRHGREVAEKRAINSTDGTGGEFVPPLWAQEDWIALAKAGRAVADACRSMPLPAGTDSINFPSVATGATTATQTDGGSVSSTDITTGSYSVGVKTIAGQQDLSQQLLDRSVPGIDQVIYEELYGRYAINLDTQVISGSGSGSNATGILSVSSINTDSTSTATVTAVYSKIAGLINSVHTGRFLPPSVIFMHPRRWAWFLAAVDGNNRPLVVPNGPAFNQAGVLSRVAPEGIVGTLQGLPVVIDANIPTNLGSGTNEDRIIVARAEDLWLMEDQLRTRVLSEVLSGTLQVRVQLYNYFAFAGGRYPKSISVLTGSALATPTF